MANEEHLAKLREGVEAWNEWRNSVKSTHPDLEGADLRGANLRGADLRGVALSDANLSRANFDCAELVNADLSRSKVRQAYLHSANIRKAKLVGADLRHAILSKADLAQANLKGSRLRNATLLGTNLRDANLIRVDLSGAKFYSTDLRGAILWDTIFSNIDLSRIEGIGECEHVGPSVIDHRTLQRSGPLPPSFLRGCGLPDSLIDYLPSLLNQPIRFYSCFISYARRDDDFAHRLHADLQDKGVRCWFAPEDLKIGDKLDQSIDLAIRVRDKLLLILSETSVASAWVTREVRTALEEEGKHDKPVLFPVRLDDAVFDTTEQWAHDLRRNRNIGDFTRWKEHDAYQKALERLLRDLKVEKD